MISLRLPANQNPIRLLIATLCVAFVLFSSLSLFLGQQLRTTAGEYDRVLAGSVRDGESLLRMQVGFKTQVQEWKNTLLRGADPEQLKKYSDQFHAEEAAVQEAGTRVASETTDPTVKAKTEEFLKAHNTMGASYQKALDFFVASKGKDMKGADAIVKGQDRAPTELLTQLVDHTSATTLNETHARDDAAKDISQLATVATALLMLLIACAVGFVVRQLIRQVGSSVWRLRDESTHLVAAGRELSLDAQDASQQAQVVSDSAKSVSSSVQSVAAAIEEMSATVQEIARNASAADAAASGAMQQAEQTNNTVARLGDASAEIGKVIAVITSIAEQTNLLALNATIEAARAGESGKGFAVVANEVKELANQTASATEEIGRKIAAIQSETSDAVAAIGEISTVIAQVNELQSSIAGAVEEQSATTSEIGRSIQEAASGMEQISTNIDSLNSRIASTSQSAQTTTGVSAGVSDVASELESLVRIGRKHADGSGADDSYADWNEPGASRRFAPANASDDLYEAVKAQRATRSHR